MTTIKKISKDGVVYELPRPIEIDIDEFKIKSDADVVIMLISEWKKDRDNYLELKKMINGCYEMLKNEHDDLLTCDSLHNFIVNDLDINRVKIKYIEIIKRWIDEKR